MPSGPRIRANNVFGIISDNPLTIGATTFNSASLFLLPVVSSAHSIVVLDPKRVNGEPEIVVVTAHTALATSATITRGAYGTTARAHPMGSAWAMVAVTDDMIPVVTSSTRPSDPFEGQHIYETDTHRPVHRDNTQWLPGGPMSVVTSGTRPANPYEGQHIYETDTDSVYTWLGSVWHEVWASDHAVRVRSSSGTNIANGTTTKITFNITDWDRNGDWRDVTDDYLVSRAGLYAVHALWYTTGGGNRLNPMVFVNGALRSAGFFQSAVTSGEQAVTVYDEFELNVSDVLDFRVENTSGAGSATGGTATGHGYPRLTIHRIGPLIP